jgi:DNA-binding MarR family transcriptional regulator
LSDSCFKSSDRRLIVILLVMNKSLRAVELRAFTVLGKGSLENHLAKLEHGGLVRDSESEVLRREPLDRRDNERRTS